jgi:hypothetical protein
MFKKLNCYTAKETRRTAGRRLTKAKDRAVAANTVEGGMVYGPKTKGAGGEGTLSSPITAAVDDADDVMADVHADFDSDDEAASCLCSDILNEEQAVWHYAFTLLSSRLP